MTMASAWPAPIMEPDRICMYQIQWRHRRQIRPSCYLGGSRTQEHGLCSLKSFWSDHQTRWFVFGQSGAGNNWGKGHDTEGANIMNTFSEVPSSQCLALWLSPTTPPSLSISYWKTLMRSTALTMRPFTISASAPSSWPRQPTGTWTTSFQPPWVMSLPASAPLASSVPTSTTWQSTWCPSHVSTSSCLDLPLSPVMEASSIRRSVGPSSSSWSSMPRTWWLPVTPTMAGTEGVTGRKARGLQMEDTGCKYQTFFISLLSGRRKQTSVIFFPLLYTNIKRGFS